MGRRGPKPLVFKGIPALGDDDRETARVQQHFEQSGPFIAVGGLAVVAFLYGYSAIALPSIVNSVLLPLFWLLLFVVATRWFTCRPKLSMMLPAVAAVVWFAAMLLVPAR